MFDNFRRFGRICSVISVGSVRFGSVTGFIHSRNACNRSVSVGSVSLFKGWGMKAQGRRRVLKSGPAKTRSRRHERGRTRPPRKNDLLVFLNAF